MAASWIRIRRLLAGVVLLTTVSAQETCSALNVTGGPTPGIYLDSQHLHDGKPYFLAADEVTPAILKYLDISEHRRLLDGSEPGAVTRSSSEIDNLVWRAYEKVDARRGQDAEGVETRYLTVCPYGFWINAHELYSTSSDSSAEARGCNYTYPLFLVPDCADHPVDVTSTWYELACESCDPAATTVAVWCSGSADEYLGTDTTPSPSGGPTAIVGTNVPSVPPEFPVIENSVAPLANTPAPSSSRVTPSPTAPRVTPTPTLPGTTPGPSPIGPGTTPTPGPSRTTPSPNLDSSDTPVPSDDESVSPTIGPSAPAFVPSPSGVARDDIADTPAPSGSGIGVRGGDLAESAASTAGIACIACLMGSAVAAMGAEALPALLVELLQ